MKRINTVLRSASITLAFTILLQHAAHAQAVVVGGEEIADVKLMAAARAEGGLYAYGFIQSESMAELLDGFRKETGLTVEYVRVPTSKLYDRVVAEFAETQFDEDRNGTYQFLREIADEYALLQQKTSGGNR